MDTQWILSLNQYIRQPDFTFYLDVPAGIGMGRVLDRNEDLDIYERAEVQEGCRKRYKQLMQYELQAQHYREPRAVEVDATQSFNDVANEVWGLAQKMVKP